LCTQYTIHNSILYKTSLETSLRKPPFWGASLKGGRGGGFLKGGSGEIWLKMIKYRFFREVSSMKTNGIGRLKPNLPPTYVFVKKFDRFGHDFNDFCWPPFKEAPPLPKVWVLQRKWKFEKVKVKFSIFWKLKN